jgi:hypothetical protein
VVDAGVLRQRARRRELLAGAEVAAVDGVAEARDDLLGERGRRVAVETIQSDFV